MILHTLHLLGGRGASRPGALLRSIPCLSKKMMTHTLRELEEMELVAREVHQVMPPVAEYRLTALGRKMVEPVETLYHWGAEHAAVLDRGDAHVTRVRKGAQGAV
ncbi:winged helix-turn-helix transcriptional regulator [Gluconacetobacter dulcium]|uniref:winged helix-turn-helix transcriptional regulator n=1 Tax=Gluconacetobacter dulcium TaxID=2729096 RepID=UPI001FEA36BA|nr:helix-turn-helix domain-containing protein [Gluconacetobacter dulcium]